jgi:hypothetical protein
MLTKEHFKVVLTYSFLLLILTGGSASREIPVEIAEAINKGNSRDLSRHFNNTIELVILDNEDVYSRSQAELIIRDFFLENKPLKFKLLHQGGKESSRYAIGNLETQSGEFRVYFLIKLLDGVPLIHLLRIEKTEQHS